MLTTIQIDRVYREVWSTIAHAKRLTAFARLIENEVHEELKAVHQQAIKAAVLAEREACIEVCKSAYPNAALRRKHHDKAPYVACQEAIAARTQEKI